MSLITLDVGTPLSLCGKKDDAQSMHLTVKGLDSISTYVQHPLSVWSTLQNYTYSKNKIVWFYK